MGRLINSVKVLILFALFALMRCEVAAAEPYVGVALGWQFNQKITDLNGDESVNYPDPASGIYPNALNPLIALYPDTTYTDLKLRTSLSAGIRGGYYFKSIPFLGVEFAFSYSEPNILRQNVKLTHPGFKDNRKGLGLIQDNTTEDQESARTRLFLPSLNLLYRYQGFGKITPYIGTGPGIFIFRITGTGHSGITTDPPSLVDPIGVPGPNILQTSTEIGLCSKVGVEYNITHNWGLAVEYHYNWSLLRINKFRSASDLDGDYLAQSVNLVLLRHF